jgi:integrase
MSANDKLISMEDLAKLASLVPRPIPWDDFIAEIKPAISRPQVGRSQERKMEMLLRSLASMGVNSTGDLTLPLVTRYIQSRPSGQSGYTLRSHLLLISRLCNMAVKRRYLIVSPFDTVPIGRFVGPLGAPQGKRHLTKDEIRRLLTLMRQDIETRKGWAQWKARRLYVVTCIGLYCGLRKMELLMLHVSDLDLEARMIRLIPHNERGKFKSEGSEQPVPIPKALVPILRDWLAHRLDAPKGFSMPSKCPWLIPTCNRKCPWTSGANTTKPLQRLQAAAKRAGIDYITMHMLRRSCSTHLESHPGIAGATITRVLRHADEEVTKKFYRRADEVNLADAVADFDF